MDRLKKIVERLEDKKQRIALLDEAFSDEPAIDDLDDILKQIIRLTVRATHARTHAQAHARYREAGVEAGRVRAESTARQLMPIFDEIQQQGVTSLSGIADALNQKEIATQFGHPWQAEGVRRVLGQMEKIREKENPNKADNDLQRMIPIIQEIKDAGISQPATIAKELNSRGVKTQLDTEWGLYATRRLLQKIDQVQNKISKA